jgi:exopolyphosphatase/guanosine-5'-triphosphate,3'-diphosphate pyrophosphatase
VRQTERHLHDDPPPADGLQELAEEVRQIIDDAVPQQVRERVETGIAVAGTATSCAAIELGLHPYDRALVHGHVLRRSICAGILGQLARLTDAERRAVSGLQPDRAPTIVAGVAMLLEVFAAFGLDEIEVSEHDILRGAALRLAGPTGAGARAG